MHMCIHISLSVTEDLQCVDVCFLLLLLLVLLFLSLFKVAEFIMVLHSCCDVCCCDVCYC